MASHSTSRRDDEDALDPVEAADEEHLDEPDLDDALIEGEDVDDVFEDDESLEIDADVDELTPARDDALTEATPPMAEPEPEPVGALSAFDDEDDAVAVAVVPEDDLNDDLTTIREGEFVCRSCYMAKRDTQLADAEAMLCRDCA